MTKVSAALAAKALENAREASPIWPASPVYSPSPLPHNIWSDLVSGGSSNPIVIDDDDDDSDNKIKSETATETRRTFKEQLIEYAANYRCAPFEPSARKVSRGDVTDKTNSKHKFIDTTDRRRVPFTYYNRRPSEGEPSTGPKSRENSHHVPVGHCVPSGNPRKRSWEGQGETGTAPKKISSYFTKRHRVPPASSGSVLIEGGVDTGSSSISRPNDSSNGHCVPSGNHKTRSSEGEDDINISIQNKPFHFTDRRKVPSGTCGRKAYGDKPYLNSGVVKELQMLGLITIGTKTVSTIELYGEDRCDGCRSQGPTTRCVVLRYPGRESKWKQGAGDNEDEYVYGDSCAKCAGQHLTCQRKGDKGRAWWTRIQRT